MPRDRVIVDGLWRCLCPSVDIASLSQPSSLWHVICARSGPPFANRGTQSRHFQQQCLRQYGHANSVRAATAQQSKRPEKSRLEYLKRLAKQSPWTPSAIFEESDSFKAKLDNISTRDIYSGLKELQDAEDSYFTITRLVEYLMKERGEKPNAALYESLIKANINKQHGSAKEAGQLLKELQSHNIPTTLAIYQALLKVRYQVDA
ncbi:hypothetical protein RRF57_012246 [Xylaria bambusicola]|uniref:Uncharacterized protein n=1 Tax=Xylaria bambusicola TaxID=326684 RepID=A0AAN7UXR9_9PEZI